MSAAWECPRCRKVNSPWLAQCLCSPPREVIVPTQNFGVSFKVPKTLPPTPVAEVCNEPGPTYPPPGEYGYGSFELRMDS